MSLFVNNKVYHYLKFRKPTSSLSIFLNEAFKMLVWKSREINVSGTGELTLLLSTSN